MTKNKARNIVIAFGQLKIEPEFYGYIAYKLTDNRQLEPITNGNDLIWGYKPKGKTVRYMSSVFLPIIDQTLYCKSKTDSSTYVTMRKKVVNSKWVEELVNTFQYKAMFFINGKVFAIDKNSVVYEVNWGIINDLLKFNQVVS